MKHTTIIVAIGLALAATLPTASANAQNARSFVSGQGSDSNSCTLAAPCRTFAVAITRTNAGGEILTLNPAGYGPVTIDKSISIVSSPGVGGVNMLTAGNAITINAGANDRVSLRGLTIDGLGIATTGIQFNTGQSLTIENCVIRHFTNTGINFFPAGAPNMTNILAVLNTLVADNDNAGITIYPGSIFAVSAIIDRVQLFNNYNYGLYVSGQNSTASTISVTVHNSVVTGRNTQNSYGFYAISNPGGSTVSLVVNHSVVTNTGQGVYAEAAQVMFTDSVASDNTTGVLTSNATGSHIRLGHSTLTANAQPWFGSNVTTFGDNYIRGSLVPSTDSAPPPEDRY